jgi:Fe2+ or Zn2+ uptake regulation protein
MLGTRVTAALQARGLKLTRARSAVLHVLSATDEHLKVAEIHTRARRIDHRIGLASVYRAMRLLTDLNLVRHIHMDHRHRHYARTTERHCHHIVCRTCGTTVEFLDCQADALVRLLTRRTKFRIDGHCMDFFGACPACLRRGAAAAPPSSQGGPQRVIVHAEARRARSSRR